MAVSRVYNMKRDQIVCDDCGGVQLRGMATRHIFGDTLRLCATCVEIHDKHPEVVSELERNTWMDEREDDY